MIIKQYVKSRKVAKITFELAKDELPADLKVESVHLVGEFNDWETAATPMKRNKKGAWNADLYVPGNFGEDNCVVMTPNG